MIYNVRMYPPAPMSYSEPIFFAFIHTSTLKELVKRGWRMKIYNAMYLPGIATKDDPFYVYERKAAKAAYAKAKEGV